MTEREIERILSEEADESKVLEAIETFIKVGRSDNEA